MRKRKGLLLAVVVAAVAVATAAGVSVFTRGDGGENEALKPPRPYQADPDRFKTTVAGKGEPNAADGPAQEAYSNQAYPALAVAPAQRAAAAQAAARIRALPPRKK